MSMILRAGAGVKLRLSLLLVSLSLDSSEPESSELESSELESSLLDSCSRCRLEPFFFLFLQNRQEQKEHRMHRRTSRQPMAKIAATPINMTEVMYEELLAGGCSEAVMDTGSSGLASPDSQLWR